MLAALRPFRRPCVSPSRRFQSRASEVREVRIQRDLAAAGKLPMQSMEDARIAALQAGGLEGGVRGALPLHGNVVTFNFEDLVVAAIRQSEYYRDLA